MKILNNLAVQIFNGLSDGIYITDLNRKIIFWNNAAEAITGYLREEVLGLNCARNILNHVDENGNQLCESHCPLVAVIHQNKRQEANVFLHHKDGHRLPVNVQAFPLTDDLNNIVAVAESFSDISDISNAKQKIDFLKEETLYDPLLKIGNRRYADLELAAKCEEKKKYGWGFAAAICDIDDFKLINDKYGHCVGDNVLKMVASTMKETLRAVDFIGRWGGEEFLIILPNMTSAEQTKHILERTKNLIRESFLVQNNEKVSVTASFGASIAGDNETPNILFDRIDKNLYKSKENGKNQITLN